MNLKKFFYDLAGRGENTDEDETETDEVSDESEETVSTDKPTRFFGFPFYRLSYKYLPNRCLNFCFITVNFILLLAGITAIITSTWMLVDSKLTSRFIGQNVLVAILLVIGIFVSMISLVGIVGFIKRNRRYMIIYIICQFLSLSVIFICAVMSFSFFDKITNKVREEMTSSIVNYNSVKRIKDAWDSTQRYLKCCGIKSYRDWIVRRIDIPESCCLAPADQCRYVSERISYKIGCLKSAVLLLKSYINTVATAALFTSLILVASLLLAYGLQKRFKRSLSNRPNL